MPRRKQGQCSGFEKQETCGNSDEKKTAAGCSVLVTAHCNESTFCEVKKFSPSLAKSDEALGSGVFSDSGSRNCILESKGIHKQSDRDQKKSDQHSTDKRMEAFTKIDANDSSFQVSKEKQEEKWKGTDASKVETFSLVSRWPSFSVKSSGISLSDTKPLSSIGSTCKFDRFLLSKYALGVSLVGPKDSDKTELYAQHSEHGSSTTSSGKCSELTFNCLAVAKPNFAPSSNNVSSEIKIPLNVLSQPLGLPSSIYGAPASDVEKVLSGMQFENKSATNAFSAESGSTLWRNETNLNRTVQTKVVTCLGNGCITSSAPCGDVWSSSVNSFEQKIGISRNYAEDLIQKSEAAVEFVPKITSPQVLEQHISKIISENAVIVQTLDPVRPKRFMKQASNQSSDRVSARKLQDSKIVINERKNSDSDISHSKLQSALLGTFQGEAHHLHSNKTSSTSLPEQFKNGKMKNFVNLEEGRSSPLKNESSVPFSKDICNPHPQNPEGSIIKDLLLKNKTKKQCTDLDKKFNVTENSSQLSEKISDPLSRISSCSACRLEFSDGKSLDAHNLICEERRNLSCSVKHMDIPPKSTNFLKSAYSTENLTIFNPEALSSSIEDLLKNSSFPVPEQPDEHCTKLVPFSLRRKSPPLKRRKISEPVIYPDSKAPQVSLVNAQGEVYAVPYRSRSHSLHLFQGNMQESAKCERYRLESSSGSAVDVTGSRINVGSNGEARIFTNVIIRNSEPPMVSGTLTQVLPVVASSADRLDKSEEISREELCKTASVSITPVIKSVVQRDGKCQVLTNDKKFCNKILPCETHFIVKKNFRPRSLSCNADPANSKSYIFPKPKPLNSLQSTAIVINSESQNKQIVPTVLFTPSSPTRPVSEYEGSSSDKSNASETKCKFLAPARPTSLPLKKKPFTMVGSTLISPDTPRPKKNCIQLYINGHAYTYLGLKCSTRSTYCCIYRPQPMFVLQETDPKLSMYSNWQVVPSKEELAGLTPGEMIAFYTSKQNSSGSIYTCAKPKEFLSLTHSSYWAFRSKEEKNEFPPKQPAKHYSRISPSLEENGCDCEESQHLEESQNTLKEINSEDYCSETTHSFVASGRNSIISESTSSQDVDTSISDGDGNNTHDDDDETDDKLDSCGDSSSSQIPKRVKIFEGGFKSNEDYTYVRGRGRGKYVCEECGIRCKKPSMLKKHIRTHTDLRPYKCRHCSFAFKTKGNLTKHMKSKAHRKKCSELGIVATSDDSQIDGETVDTKDHLKTQNNFHSSDGEDDEEDDDDEDFDDSDAEEEYESDCSMITTITKSTLVSSGHSPSTVEYSRSEMMGESTSTSEQHLQHSVEHEAARSLLHLSSLSESSQPQWSVLGETENSSTSCSVILPTAGVESSEIFVGLPSQSVTRSGVLRRTADAALCIPEQPLGHRPRSYSADVPCRSSREQHQFRQSSQSLMRRNPKLLETVTVKEDSEFDFKETGTRRFSISVAREAQTVRGNVQSPFWERVVQEGDNMKPNEAAEQPMDLRISRTSDACQSKHFVSATTHMPLKPLVSSLDRGIMNSEIYVCESLPVSPSSAVCSPKLTEFDGSSDNSRVLTVAVSAKQSQQQVVSESTVLPQQLASYYCMEGSAEGTVLRTETDLDHSKGSENAEMSASSPISPSSLDENFFSQDNADISQNSSEMQFSSKTHSEFLKPSTSNMEEGKCVCRICNKIFAKAGQLRIHVNIHYFERPFRCENCSVSFRTKGHLQKHKRSVSHYNKVNMNMTFGTPSVDNPRPFKCADCKIAFRIHGHLAKHLRSKMHIMKLECLGKLPFGMYAEMERSGVSLNEIDTTDCNNSLESLQAMAQKLYHRDPRRMRWHSPNSAAEFEAEKCSSMPVVSADSVSEQLSVTLNSTDSIGISLPSIVNLSPPVDTESDVKQEPSSDAIGFNSSSSTFLGKDAPFLPSAQFGEDQNVLSISIPQLQKADLCNNESISLHRSDTCHLCGRMFKSAKFLQVHLYCDHSSWSSTSGEISSSEDSNCTQAVQDLICDLCGKHFASQSNLKQHLLTHAKPRPFVCEVCDAGFTSSVSLVAHMATHQSSGVTSAAASSSSLNQ